MGNHKNISYDIFPRQNQDLGTGVKLGLDGERVVPAVIIRSDAEEPGRKIFRTLEGIYISSEELDNFRLPRQGTYLGKNTKVYFHYQDRFLEGRIVRDDMEEPFNEFIELADGRVISKYECQYCPFDEEVIQKVKTPATKDIEQIKRQLSRKNSSQRIRLLQGIYNQLVPSRKRKIAGGEYNQRYSNYQKDHSHFIATSDFDKASQEFLVDQILNSLYAKDFVSFLVNEMMKYPRLQDQAARLYDAYPKNLKVRFPKELSGIISINSI